MPGTQPITAILAVSVSNRRIVELVMIARVYCIAVKWIPAGFRGTRRSRSKNGVSYPPQQRKATQLGEPAEMGVETVWDLGYYLSSVGRRPTSLPINCSKMGRAPLDAAILLQIASTSLQL